MSEVIKVLTVFINQSAMDQQSQTQGKIALSGWNGLAELRNPEDDWTGVSSWQERRKIQNRLSQRARRKCLPD